MSTTQSDPWAVDVEHLSRAFRGVDALCDVSLQIPVGSIFGLVGLNGAGKTTLIRHLIGSLRPLHGRVRVLGEDPIADPEGVLKRIGYLTEEDSLPKWMRVGDLIDFSRAIYPSWDDTYARQLCEMFSLTSATRLQTLSKGQRARAGLLIAIAHRPELLILDEPSSGLDPIARSDILEAIIRTVSDDGRTVLFSSHLLEEVNRVCDQVAFMKAGRIVESLSIDTLHQSYEEIVYRSTDDETGPPEIAGAFGWQLVGREWSAVIPSGTEEAAAVSPGWQPVTRREISMQRWFAARAESEFPNVPSSSDFSDTDDEERRVSHG